jgi:hypothetical protein
MNIILFNSNSKDIFSIEDNYSNNLKIELNYNLFYDFKIIEINNINYSNKYYFICDKKNRIKIHINNLEYLIPTLMDVSDFIKCYKKNCNIVIKNKFNIELFLDDFFSENENYFLMDILSPQL